MKKVLFFSALVIGLLSVSCEKESLDSYESSNLKIENTHQNKHNYKEYEKPYEPDVVEDFSEFAVENDTIED